jgi:hypothetical protein
MHSYGLQGAKLNSEVCLRAIGNHEINSDGLDYIRGTMVSIIELFRRCRTDKGFLGRGPRLDLALERLWRAVPA